MIPVKTPDCNHVYYVDPRNTEKGRLDCVLTEDSVTSFWLAELDDDLTAGAIYVHYLHGFRPTTELALGRSLAEADFVEYPLMRAPTNGPAEYQTNMPLNDEVRDYLLSGGGFILRTYRVPPPPVSIWAA